MNHDIAEGKWKQMVGKAKTAWGELTDDELTTAEGRVDKLTGLIQQRYARTRQQAELEVRHSTGSTGQPSRPCRAPEYRRGVTGIPSI